MPVLVVSRENGTVDTLYVFFWWQIECKVIYIIQECQREEDKDNGKTH